jgi:hypothetical protein
VAGTGVSNTELTTAGLSAFITVLVGAAVSSPALSVFPDIGIPFSEISTSHFPIKPTAVCKSAFARKCGVKRRSNEPNNRTRSVSFMMLLLKKFGHIATCYE